MDDWLDHYRRMQEQIDKILEPQRRFREQMKKMMEPYRRNQDQMERWMEPTQKLYAQMKTIGEQQRLMMEQFQRSIEPQRSILEQINNWIDSKSHLYSQINKMQEALTQWQIPDIAGDMQARINEFINSQNMLKHTYDDLLGNITNEDIQVEASGSISVAGETVLKSELSTAFNEILPAIEKISSPIQVIEFLANFLSKYKKPIARVVMLIIFQLMISISANLMTPYFANLLENLTHKPKREQINAIKREAVENYDLKELSDFRFVTADILNVRQKGTVNSKCLDKIHFGQVVKILKKGRHWSYIQYANDNSGEEIQGWVFNRYLDKVKK